MRGPPTHPTQRGLWRRRLGAAQLDETLQTLRYAENAKLVKNRPRRYALRNREHSSVCPQHAGPERVASGSCLRQLSVRALTKL